MFGTRAAARRLKYEMEAQLQSEIQPAAPDPFWEEMSPLLDEALGKLNEKDRQALIDQLGLEVVPDRRPVEMLVMEKVK